MEDKQLIELYFARSEEAIGETAKKYGPYCRAIAGHILTNSADVEECVSDTWLRAWGAIPPNRPERLGAFLGKITRRISLNRWRSRTREKRGGGEVPLALDELAECFTRGRARFEREFQRARDAGSKVYLLVEDASYEDILLHRYRSKFATTAFIGSIISWSIRYNMTPVFCRAETSGVIIREILLRDMRARLEEGEYG